MAGLAAPAQVGLDSDGMLLLNGKRTFLLGLYQLPLGPDPWKRAAEAGFHVVSAGARRDMLDEAGRHGMYGWATAGSQDASLIRKLVGELKDHPALLYWETEDEPSFVWKKPREVRVPPEAIEAAYKLVKSIDPAHPLYLNHSPTNLVSTLQRYNPGGDLIATDIYPVVPYGLKEQYALWPDGQQGDLLNTTISQVGQYTDKLRRVAGPSRGVLMVLQGFAWEMLRDKDADPRMVRYPTLAETRFMAYQAIVHGATGLIWWGLYKTPPESGLWESIAATARELKGIASELAAPAEKLDVTLDYHDTGHSIDRGIEWTARPSLLIAVNADKNPVDVTMRAGAWAGRAEFEPFGVKLFRLKK
jgi:hypothetical protein